MANVNDVIAALSDPTRRAVFERLVHGPRSVVDVAKGLPVSRPAVSQHLKVLKDAGLVFDTRDGARRLYQVDPAGVELAWRYFDRFWNKALTGFKEAAERAQRAPHAEDKS
ncbi:MAG TPA: metalloregulator ArsR/SmtB family transcription factor [Vicinamibacterales bacterium]|jgi:DNA-binding transcriptional ArsR family regulator|nr:metalloregulator ArsR/SmtB family transcription factor [Vicinamibacterales bacterium]